MSQISLLDDKMKHIQRTLQQLEQERAVHLDKLEGWKMEQEALLQEELKAQAELDQINKKLEDLYELKKETDVYYKQIQQSVETLLSLLSTPTARWSFGTFDRATSSVKYFSHVSLDIFLQHLAFGSPF